MEAIEITQNKNVYGSVDLIVKVVIRITQFVISVMIIAMIITIIMIELIVDAIVIYQMVINQMIPLNPVYDFVMHVLYALLRIEDVLNVI